MTRYVTIARIGEWSLKVIYCPEWGWPHYGRFAHTRYLSVGPLIFSWGI